jgi:hypothetical protein
MGFCDYVTLEQGCQEYGLTERRSFQTKSLYAGGAEFTITRDGKLVEHSYRYEDDPDRIHPITGSPLLKRIPLGEKVIDYHGDILLHYYGTDDISLELVARFTHGRLEWLRPLAEYPEENRVLLVDQGAQ